MRYFIVTPLLFTLFFLASPAAAGRGTDGHSADFREMANDLSEDLDQDWQRAVGKASGGRAAIMSPAFGPGRRTRARGSRPASSSFGSSRSYSDVAPGWSGVTGSGGFIHKGISGQFLPNVTRKRGGATRGLGMSETPAARLRGLRREPFNASGLNRLGSSPGRGAVRKSVRFGTRTGSSVTRRGRATSTRTLGSGRTRRRR